MAPAVAGEVVVIGSCGGTIYGLDRNDGTSVWSYDTSIDGARAQFHGEALVRDGMIYIGADGLREAFLYAIDAASGEIVWKRPFPYGVPTELLEFEESIAFVTGEGVLVSVDPQDGSIRWRHEPKTLSQGRQRASATFTGGTIVYHASDGTIYLVESSSGDLRDEISVGSPATASPIVIGDRIYIAAEGGSIMGIDPISGETTGAMQVDGRVYGSLTTDSERLFALIGSREEARLVAIDGSLDQVLWDRSAQEWSSFRPLVGEGTITVGTRGQFCTFRVTDGEVISCIPIEGIARSFSVEGDQMLVGTIGGTVFSLERVDIADSERLRSEAVPLR